MPTDSTNRLQTSFLCRELNQKELKAIAEIVSLRLLKKGEILFWEGDAATGFYVLLSGSVRVYKASADGKEYTIHQIRPGQMFAEAAIFSGRGYPANCAALADSEVAFFPKDRFLGLVKSSPDISLKMISGLSVFVREFAEKVEDLSLKEVSARLARFLLEQSEETQKKNIRLDTSKAELANRLGTISETLSRNLKKLRELEVIAVEGDLITILDSHRLESIAAGEKI